MGEWRTMSLAEAGVMLLDCVHKTPQAQSTGLPYIAIPQMNNGEIDPTTARNISHSDFLEWTSKALPIRHDVVLSRRCNPGATAYVRGDFQFALGQNLVLLRSNGTLVIQKFLRWLVRSPGWWNQIRKFLNVGAVFDSLRCADIPNFRLTIPPIEDQQAIAAILGSLDDKIDCNRRMNETLEAMARAIFKDWFVDFGPTRAKMEGRAPYLAQEIWDLFPDRLDDEGKPEGWEYGVLGDIATQVGQTVSPESLPPETPYIGLEHMPRRSIALDTWEGAEKVTSGKLAFKRGDFLFGKLRPYFHKVGIAPLEGICSTDIMVLNSRAPETSSFVITCISQEDFVNFTNRTSDGTKMPRTSWGRMEKYEICKPSRPCLTAFDQIAAKLYQKIVANVHESRTLAQTRDLLLPKLMSGEIRVKDAEKAAGALL